MDFQGKLAAALDEYRSKKKIGNQELAEMTGINQSSLSLFLNNRRSASLKYIEKILDALELEVVVRPHGYYVDKANGEHMVPTESQYQSPATNMADEIAKRTEYLYMSSGEAAFYRTGFKNGVTWAEAVLSMVLKTLEYGDMVNEESANEIIRQFSQRTSME